MTRLNYVLCDLSVGLRILIPVILDILKKNPSIKIFSLITLILNVLMMLIAFYLSKSLIANASQQRAITLECGLQNGTLAIFVATSIFGGGLYVIPAATYSLIMFITSLIFVYIVRKTI